MALFKTPSFELLVFHHFMVPLYCSWWFIVFDVIWIWNCKNSRVGPQNGREPVQSKVTVIALFRVCFIFKISNSCCFPLLPTPLTPFSMFFLIKFFATKPPSYRYFVLSKSLVTLKRVTVFVATSPPIQHQQTVVLSAAVSRTKYIPKDCKVADTIAKRMDMILQGNTIWLGLSNGFEWTIPQSDAWGINSSGW